MELKSGMSGSDVQNLQLKLIAAAQYHNRADFNLPVYGADGQYGQETLQAVLNFQRAVGITADGIAGDQTMSALDAVLESSAGGVDFYTSPYSKVTGQPVNPPIVVSPPTAPVITGKTIVQKSPASAASILPAGIDWKVIGIGVAIIFGLMFMTQPEKKGKK